jgi:hypothetical protein
VGFAEILGLFAHGFYHLLRTMYATWAPSSYPRLPSSTASSQSLVNLTRILSTPRWSLGFSYNALIKTSPSHLSLWHGSRKPHTDPSLAVSTILPLVPDQTSHLPLDNPLDDFSTTSVQNNGGRSLRHTGLKGTHNLCLKLSGANPISLLRYSDSDYANCPDSSKSIGSYCFSLGSGVIFWAPWKQKTVTDSSCYAEYVLLRELLSCLIPKTTSATTLCCNNNTASILTKDHIWHARVKHIRVKYHYVRELVANNEVAVRRIRSADNSADIFTKPLNKTDYIRLHHSLGLTSSPAASGC